MTSAPNWNDAARDSLRDALRRVLLGEIRLAKANRHTILEACLEAYINEECPKIERDGFVRFASDEYERVARRHAADQATWPRETDCDRLDQVEADLRDRGILLWQVSPCCDTCSRGELPDRVEAIERRYPGFRGRVRGYAFYIEQNMADNLADDTRLSVYLAYGWLPSSDSDVPHDVYETNALSIATEVCELLRARGFEPEWNGNFSRKIGVSVNWQRRSMLS